MQPLLKGKGLRARAPQTARGACRMASKKRKPEAVDSFALEAERSLHQSFVHAANAVSQLYTSSLTGNKRAHVDGARQVLVRLSPARPARRTAAAWTGAGRLKRQRVTLTSSGAPLTLHAAC